MCNVISFWYSLIEWLKSALFYREDIDSRYLVVSFHSVSRWNCHDSVDIWFHFGADHVSKLCSVSHIAESILIVFLKYGGSRASWDPGIEIPKSIAGDSLLTVKSIVRFQTEFSMNYVLYGRYLLQMVYIAENLCFDLSSVCPLAVVWSFPHCFSHPLKAPISLGL
jgi:hypothetical protein